MAVVQGAVERIAPGGSAVFLFSGTPRAALLRWVLLPFYRGAAARFVDPDPVRQVPGCELVERRSGGLATLALFRADAAPGT